MPQVTYEREAGTAIVTINRPEKLNALTREMILTLSDVFKSFATMPDLRVVILTGSGESAFCVGTDISELADADHEQALNISNRGQTLCDLIAQCPVPVIAAINGLAVGGGCELALACHMRLATTSARFSLPEIKLGIIPGYGGTQRLARELGGSRALEMLLTGHELSGVEAEKFGLVNRVAEPDNLLTEARSLANEISKLAPLAIRACLKSVRLGMELPLQEGLALEAQFFAELFDTADMREGARAFLEKRAPVFKGE